MPLPQNARGNVYLANRIILSVEFASSGQNLIPTGINQNPYVHFRRPIDMIFHG